MKAALWGHLLATAALGLPGFASNTCAQEIRLGSADGWKAEFDGAALVKFTDSEGRKLVEPGPEETGVHLVVGGKTYQSRATTTAAAEGEKSLEFSDFPGLPDATAKLTFHRDESDKDLVVVQSAHAPAGELESAEWVIGYIPLDYNILIP
jgi:hypothetical protein